MRPNILFIELSVMIPDDDDYIKILLIVKVVVVLTLFSEQN